MKGQSHYSQVSPREIIDHLASPFCVSSQHLPTRARSQVSQLPQRTFQDQEERSDSALLLFLEAGGFMLEAVTIHRRPYSKASQGPTASCPMRPRRGLSRIPTVFLGSEGRRGAVVSSAPAARLIRTSVGRTGAWGTPNEVGE